MFGDKAHIAFVLALGMGPNYSGTTGGWTESDGCYHRRSFRVGWTASGVSIISQIKEFYVAQFTSRVAVRPNHRRGFVTGVAFAAAVLFASTASAQETAGSQDATASAVVSVVATNVAPNAETVTAPARVNMAGPLLQRGEVRFVPAASRDEVNANANMMEQRAPSRRASVAFLIVGLAAMIIGSEVDDAPGDLIVLGGAGFAIYGIYGLVR